MSFWDWSINKYASPDVQKLCLEMQDKYGLDVNVLLWSVWVAQVGKEPSDQDWILVNSLSEWFQDSFLNLLRRVRRSLKSSPSYISVDESVAVKRLVLNAELELEKLEQSELEKITVGFKQTQQDVRENAAKFLNTYLDLACPGHKIDLEMLIDALLEDR